MNKINLSHELNNLEITIYIAESYSERIKNLVSANSNDYSNCLRNEILIERAKKSYEILRNVKIIENNT